MGLSNSLENAPAGTRALSSRLSVLCPLDHDFLATLARDVMAGLGDQPKKLPPKYFYDDLGSQLFDRICDTPEYYQTRTEQALLERIAGGLVEEIAPTDVIELGSGAARKTRAVLDAVHRSGRPCRYVPFDVSEGMLRRSARQLLDEYEWLTVSGIVGDYDRHLSLLPPGNRRLLLFLGGTIGNSEPEEAVRFLSRVRANMGPCDRLLLGTDLVKDHAVLNAAYNDRAGVTASFNKNVLSVINGELDGHFDLARFEHVAFFEPECSQIEMHLRSTIDQTVCVDRLEMHVDFAAGETMRTEISRKFSRASVASMLAASGLELCHWFVPDNDYFALSLSKPV
jgi:L-histidine Nalpha-methyltransferase